MADLLEQSVLVLSWYHYKSLDQKKVQVHLRPSSSPVRSKNRNPARCQTQFVIG